uniref:ATP-binding cassette domain-containing protein n=1 Tax=Halorubrum lacusprofundi TaxID=2247 RepID=UPI001179CE07
RDLTVGYAAVPVVEDVSLRVERGEYVGIVGPNGSGKSTLRRLLLGLHEPDSGTAELLGHPARAFAERERVGYVAQDVPAAEKRMPITVSAVVLMGRFPHAGFGRVTEDDRNRTRDALRTGATEPLSSRTIPSLTGAPRPPTSSARPHPVQAQPPPSSAPSPAL